MARILAHPSSEASRAPFGGREFELRSILEALQALSRVVGMELAAERGAQAGRAAAMAGPEKRPFLFWINASRGSEVKLINVDDVSYFQSDSKYTRVVAFDRDWLIRKTITQLATELDPSKFRQMHRATIVNVGAVESVGRD